MANDKRKSFLEDFLKIRIKGKPGKESDAGIATKGNTLVDVLEKASEAGKIVDISEFQQFRTLGTDRNEQYRMYDEMAYDSVVSAALELYSDDATQYNSKGQIVWVESEDPTIAQFANRLIDNLQINEHIWSYAYNLVKYGDVYLQLFKDDEIQKDPLIQRLDHTDVDTVTNRKGSVLEEYIELVPNPARLFDLSNRGKTVGFVEVQLADNSDGSAVFKNYMYNMNDTNIKVYEPKKFVHIMLNPDTDRFPEKLSLTFDGNVTGEDPDSAQAKLDQVVVNYNVKRGKSILHDQYKTYRELQLMEDALLLNRVTRSSIIRLLQIEIGDMPSNQAEQLLHRYKNLIEQKNYMDKDAGSFTSAANPGPIDNVLYIPTRDGKGAVSMSNLGGDVDVKAITDVDYFKNKYYAGYKIPRQFLGETDEGGGFSGGTSLTKLDARYARTIKRIQNAIISGLTTLINIFALNRELPEYVNNFTVKMVSPATTEDAERDETLNNRIDIVSRFMELIPEGMASDETLKDILITFMSEYLSEPDVAGKLDEDDTLEKNKEDVDMDFGVSGGGPRGGNDIDIDLGGGTSSHIAEPTGSAENNLNDTMADEEPEFDFGDVEL